MAFGERVKAELKKRKLSARYLAQQSGLDEGSLSRLIRGERNPTGESLQKIASALGVTTQYLLTGSNEPEPPAPEVRSTTVVYEDDYPSRAAVIALLRGKVDPQVFDALVTIRFELDGDPGEEFWLKEVRRLKRLRDRFEVDAGAELQPMPGDRMPPEDD